MRASVQSVGGLLETVAPPVARAAATWAAARLFGLRLGAMSNDGELLLGLFSYVVCEVTSCLPTYTTTELMYHAIERLSREFMFGRTWLKAR